MSQSIVSAAFAPASEIVAIKVDPAAAIAPVTWSPNWVTGMTTPLTMKAGPWTILAVVTAAYWT